MRNVTSKSLDICPDEEVFCEMNARVTVVRGGLANGAVVWLPGVHHPTVLFLVFLPAESFVIHVYSVHWRIFFPLLSRRIFLAIDEDDFANELRLLRW